MANVSLKTRIKLKYDTLTNWNTNNPVLLKGEIALVDPGITASDGSATIMIKVGNGTKKFSELGYTWGQAADVYAWAKAATKPTYTAKEVGALPANTHIPPDVTDTDTQYQLVLSGHTLKLQSKAKGATSWTDAQTLTLPDNNTTYTFSSTATSGASFKVTPNGGTAQTVYIDGLGTAAFKATGDFATAAQGAKADAALPSATFETFKTANTSAIADAKKAGTNAASELTAYKKTNDIAVSANATAISNLQSAVKSGVTFKGKITTTALPSASTYVNGDLIIFGTKEYICYNDGTSNTWVELGDEGTHLTKTTADGYYVPLGRTIAGVDLKDNVTKAELQTALNVADGATKVTESTVSGWGFTKNAGTVTGIKINGTTKTPTSGVVDVGTVITSHQDISGKQDKLTAGSNISISGTTISATNTNQTIAVGDIAFGANDAVKISGSGATTVSGNATNKTITISSTDSKVTSAANHYTPSADSSAALSATASSTTAASWNSTSLVTGVNLQRDSKGHVTGVTVNSIKMPANPNVNPNDGKLTDKNGNTIFSANASATSQIIEIDCGDSTSVI